MTLSERRRALGLSTSQLAHRLGVSQSSVVRLESSEKRGSISIASLRRAAEALGCELVYELRSEDRSRSGTFPETRGLRRIARSSAKKTSSRLSEGMRRQVELLASALSPAERIEQACSISDLTYEIHQCSKKR